MGPVDSLIRVLDTHSPVRESSRNDAQVANQVQAKLLMAAEKGHVPESVHTLIDTEPTVEARLLALNATRRPPDSLTDMSPQSEARRRGWMLRALRDAVWPHSCMVMLVVHVWCGRMKVRHRRLFG